MQHSDQEVREMCTRIIEERDPNKLSRLMIELEKVLEEREERLRNQAQ
jgi:hypothetical protein